MPDNTRPAGNLPDWANDRVGGNNTAVNPALGAIDITEPGVARKDVGWQSGDIPPRNWWNWMIHKAGAWIRWCALTVGDAFVFGHHDSNDQSVSLIPLQGFHRDIMQMPNPTAAIGDNRYLLRQVGSDPAGTAGMFREYRDEEALPAAQWQTFNAFWNTTTSRWVKDDAALAAHAIKMQGSHAYHYAVPIATNNWTDAQWLTVMSCDPNEPGGPVVTDMGMLFAHTMLIASTPGAAGTGDLIFQSGILAAATHGFLYLPEMTAANTPTGVPDSENVALGMPIVVARDRRLWWWRDLTTGTWIQRPLDPVRAHYESSLNQIVLAGQDAAVDFDVKIFDDPLADRVFGGTFACDQVAVVSHSFTIPVLDATASFPIGSRFHHNGGAAGNNTWFTVQSRAFGGGNTTVVSVEAPGANEGPGAAGRMVNRRYVADRAATLWLAAQIGVNAVAGNAQCRMFAVINPTNGMLPANSDRQLDEQFNLLTTAIMKGACCIPITTGQEMFIWIENVAGANLNVGTLAALQLANFLSIHEV